MRGVLYVHGQRNGRGGIGENIMRNTYWANTCSMDDFGNMIERSDMDSIDLMVHSLSSFYFD